MYFSATFSDTTLWLLCGSAVCVVLSLTIYLLRVMSVVRYRRRQEDVAAGEKDVPFLPASVIVYSQDDADNLSELLKSILNQDYPAEFEVIVVNDGESTDVRDAVGMLRPSHPNLYLTFTPEGVVNLSRKKLALTLGIKAARYDVVVLTTASAIIPGRRWLRHMMAPFSTGTGVEVVLGYAGVDPSDDRAFGSRCRAFDHAAESVRWLSAAIAGHPFRGTEFNLAYRKDVFIRNKGFARSLNLCHGDDDLFISAIANRNNTEVVLTEESMVVLRHGNHPRLFRERTLRRIFTEGHIRRRPRLLPGVAATFQLAALAMCVVAAVMALPNIAAAVFALVIMAVPLTADVLMWRSVMAALNCRRLMLSLPWFTLTYPLRRISAHLRARIGHQKKYTWN